MRLAIPVGGEEGMQRQQQQRRYSSTLSVCAGTGRGGCSFFVPLGQNEKVRSSKTKACVVITLVTAKNGAGNTLFALGKA